MIMASAGGANDEKTPEPANTENNDTLKYSLLGPSLTKAGQDKVDQQKVSKNGDSRRSPINVK